MQLIKDVCMKHVLLYQWDIFFLRLPEKKKCPRLNPGHFIVAENKRLFDLNPIQLPRVISLSTYPPRVESSFNLAFTGSF